MSTILTWIGGGLLVLMVLAVLVGLNIIAIFYPQPVQNDPLLNPVDVVEVGADYFVVDDGRRFTVDAYSSGTTLAELIRESGHRVDIEEYGDFVAVYVDAHLMQCRVRASLIKLDLIPTEVPGRRRASMQALVERTPRSAGR